MSRKFSQFNEDMEALAKRFEEGANKLVVDASAEAGRYVSGSIPNPNDNPIDTGLSSGNWQADVGAVKSEKLERFFPTSSGAEMNALQQKRKRTGQSVFLSNSVDYIKTIINLGTATRLSGWAGRAARAGLHSFFKKKNKVL